MGKLGLLGKIFKKTAETAHHPFCSAVVAAAGSSERMGEDKLFASLAGEPVLLRSLKELQASPFIHEIVVVTKEESIVTVTELAGKHGLTKVTKIVRGGADRMESVMLGAAEVSEKAKYLAIHDGARPLVTQDVISHAVKAAYKHKAAAPAVAVKDTVKVAEKRVVKSTPDRDTMFTVQTPQVFQVDLIKGALQNAKDKKLTLTDDCGAVEAMGSYVYLSDGSYENIKITTPIDLTIAEAILKARIK